MNLYTKTDEQLHWLCQIIAKANRTFVPKKEDDSHTNLYFDSLGDRIVGRKIQTKSTELLFALNLNHLDIEILDSSQKVLASYKTVGKTVNAIEAEIDGTLKNFGLTDSGFREKLHFEIPVYEFQEDPILAIDKTALDEWKSFRVLANEACSLLLGHAQVTEEIRIWPHHFDTGIYILVKEKLGIGFGLAMKDGLLGSPYFYMSGYPTEGNLNYQDLPEGKDWGWEISKNWNGAVLSLDQLVDKTYLEQRTILKDYLTESFKWYLQQ